MTKNKKKSDRLVNLGLVGILVLGLAILGYPTFADWWNSYHQSRAVASYVSAVANLDPAEYDAIIAEAEAYNTRMAETGVQWTMTDAQKAEYNAVLDITGSGIMGYIDIPKANIKLPIYHGTDESVLQVAVGHLEGSSLPVGGESSHCVVTGHRGLPSARLFTDIDRLTKGDTFTLTILNRTYTYEVYDQTIVEPTDLSNLTIEAGKDLVTLVTCTPYGVNSHRLLVHARRIENPLGVANVNADAIQLQPVYVAPLVATPMLFILLVILLISTRKKKSTRERVTEYIEESMDDMNEGGISHGD